MKKALRVWRQMEDHCQRNLIFASAVLAIPDFVTITESVAYDGTWNAILGFGHVFFLILLALENQDPYTDSAS